MGRKWLNNIVSNQNNNSLPIAQDGRNLKRLLDENIKTDSNSIINYTKLRSIDPKKDIKNKTARIENVQKKNNVSRKKAIEIIQKEEFDKNVARNPQSVGEISIPEDQSVASKTWEVLTNPVTAASYWLNDQRIPDRFSKGERNNLDIATDLFNPFGIVESAKNAVKETINLPKNLYNGEYEEAGSNFLNAGLNTLSVIPALRELKGVKPTNIKNTLNNAYKYNPWAFKPNPEAYYRGIGKEGVDDIIESGIIRSKKQNAYPEPYFSKGIVGDKYAKGYFAELTDEPMKGVGAFKTGDLIQTPVNKISINNPNLKIYKKHWLQGYKPVKVPEFKSEIDWSKWNKEIPENTQLMNEYNVIEQTSKSNGTWMKNSDGSKFKGTPEQFVQQNSQNFKRAFGDTPNIAYRGQTRPTETIGGGDRGYSDGISYLGDKDQAITYAETWKHPRHSGKIYQPGLSDPNAPALYELMYPNSTNTKIITHSEPRNWQKLIDDDVASQMDEVYLNFRGKSNKGEQFINTDDVGTYVAKNNLDHAYISNIMDYNRKPSRKFFNLLPGKNVGNTVIMNSKPGNYLKSRWYNNGMFDMTNPNIYKSVLPISLGLGAASQIEQKKEGGVIKDNNGYWNPNNWGKVVEIGSNDITMKGVNQPLLGISDEGDIQYMEPNKDYKFKGKKVREFPIARNGINNLNENSLQQLDQLTNFTNYNKLSNGGWLDKF